MQMPAGPQVRTDKNECGRRPPAAPRLHARVTCARVCPLSGPVPRPPLAGVSFPGTPARKVSQDKRHLPTTPQAGLGLHLLLPPPPNPRVLGMPAWLSHLPLEFGEVGAVSVSLTSAFRLLGWGPAHSRYSVFAASFPLPGQAKVGDQGLPRPCAQPCLKTQLHSRWLLIRCSHCTGCGGAGTGTGVQRG